MFSLFGKEASQLKIDYLIEDLKINTTHNVGTFLSLLEWFSEARPLYPTSSVSLVFNQYRPRADSTNRLMPPFPLLNVKQLPIVMLYVMCQRLSTYAPDKIFAMPLGWYHTVPYPLRTPTRVVVTVPQLQLRLSVYQVWQMDWIGCPSLSQPHQISHSTRLWNTQPALLSHPINNRYICSTCMAFRQDRLHSQ